MSERDARMTLTTLGLIASAAVIGVVALLGVPGGSTAPGVHDVRQPADTAVAPGHERVRLHVEGMA